MGEEDEGNEGCEVEDIGARRGDRWEGVEDGEDMGCGGTAA